jgi:tetratricopeptide (TPR) repeat protein
MAAIKARPEQAAPTSHAGSAELVMITTLEKAKPYFGPACAGLVVIMLMVFAFIYFRNNQKLHTAKAYQELHSILNIEVGSGQDNPEAIASARQKKEKLDRIRRDFKKTPAAIDAKLHLANIDFSMGKYVDAAAQYAAFYNEFPNYQPLSTMAKLAEAKCYLAKNEFDTAITKYKNIYNNSEISSNQPRHALRAKFQAALCSFLAGHYEEAKVILDDLLASSDDDLIESRAQSLLARIAIIPADDIREAILSSEKKGPLRAPEATEVSTSLTPPGDNEASDTAKQTLDPANDPKSP